MSCHVHAVILEVDDLTVEFLFHAEMYNLLYQFLARCVMRMRLPCKNELHRIFRVIDNAGKAFFIPEKEIGSFVSCESSGKTDSGFLRIENRFVLKVRLEQPHPSYLLFPSIPCPGDKSFPHSDMSRPEFGIRDPVNFFPFLRICLVAGPSWTDVPAQQFFHLIRDPCFRMNSVCYMRNGCVRGWESRPDILPDFP